MSKFSDKQEKEKLRKRVAQPVGYDDFGRPIYGFNADKVPVCYARKRNGSQDRCMNTARFENGRCKYHGGKSATGLARPSVRSGYYCGKLPKNTGKHLAEVVNDPDYISQKEEMGLNTLQIGEILEGLANGQEVDSMTWQEVLKLAEQAERIIFDAGVQSFITQFGTPGNKLFKLADVVEKLVLRCKSGANRKRLWKELNEASEYRRKLAETEIKYSLMSKNNMPADRVILIFKSLVDIVKDVWSEDTARLKIFGNRLDEFSLNEALNTGVNPLQAKLAPSALINPESRLTEGIEKEDIEDEDIIDIEEISVDDEQGRYGENNKRVVRPATTVRKKNVKRKFKL